MNEYIRKLRVRPQGKKQIPLEDKHVKKIIKAMNHLLDECDRTNTVPNDTLLAHELGYTNSKTISRHRNDSVEFKTDQKQVQEVLKEYKDICAAWLTQGSLDGSIRERSANFQLQVNHGMVPSSRTEMDIKPMQSVQILDDFED